MPESPQDFYARIIAQAGTDGRLPLPDLTGWADVFPFELAGLRIAPFQAPQPEKPRMGEGGADCRICTGISGVVWTDGTWRLKMLPEPGGVLVLMLEPLAHFDYDEMSDETAAELGRLSVHVVRAIEALPHIARAHVYRIGDGAEHMHIWFFARPSDQLQLRGSYLVSWDDVLPPMPEEIRQADAGTVAATLAHSYGGQVID